MNIIWGFDRKVEHSQYHDLVSHPLRPAIETSEEVDIVPGLIKICLALVNVAVW